MNWSLLFERTVILVVGLALGYILGRLHKSKGSQVNERGAARLPRFKKPKFINVMALVIVVIVSYSAFQSNRASNDAQDAVSQVQDVQAQSDNIQNCISIVLFDTVQALEGRTLYTTSQTDANIELQKAQLRLVTVGSNAELSEEEQTVLFQEYVEALRHFVKTAVKTQEQQELFPYPTTDSFVECLATAREGKVVPPETQGKENP